MAAGRVGRRPSPRSDNSPRTAGERVSGRLGERGVSPVRLERLAGRETPSSGKSKKASVRTSLATREKAVAGVTLEGALRHGSDGEGIADADHLSRDSGGAALEVDDLLRGVDEAPLAACEGGEEGRPLCGGAEAGRTEGDEAFVWGS